MEVKLSDRQAAIVMSRLERGVNDSAHDVLEEALDRLVEDEIIAEHDLNELRASIERTDKQFARGEGIQIDDPDVLADRIMLRAVARAQRHASSKDA
jgi:hypothetical protein